MIDKVASIVDLELESSNSEEGKIEIGDIVSHNIEDKLTINLRSTDGQAHYALLYVTLSMNSKNELYAELSNKITENENAIKEIVTEEFAKYTIDEVNTKKDAIKEQILIRIQELFQSDFIINVYFGNIVLS